MLRVSCRKARFAGGRGRCAGLRGEAGSGCAASISVYGAASGRGLTQINGGRAVSGAGIRSPLARAAAVAARPARATYFAGAACVRAAARAVRPRVRATRRARRAGRRRRAVVVAVAVAVAVAVRHGMAWR
ncbi:hypothetical protein GTC3P0254_22340 [Burkholderia pseudomallei]|nr:hypothetical protein GTC019_58520 [Burkholderia pseudomallei]BEH40726.1 hypothetical protein GTC254T_58210 [Burkholderia pseudomallei]BEH58654.1 hypothetical protein BpKM376_58330 [Burkholderia pseudomallei]BEH70808.1 hypothetical protein BpKM391_58830 [Burkholderia pseudomallei]GEA55257.1 hypothetical protein GTC3P0254_22340 [Burkholderia pseudomallei]